jgi:excisionase family DNA binding protein
MIDRQRTREVVMPDKSFVTLAELSQASGLSASTIRRLVRDERIPHLQPSGKGGKLLFPRDAIERTSRAQGAGSVASARLAGRRPTWMDNNP